MAQGKSLTPTGRKSGASPSASVTPVRVSAPAPVKVSAPPPKPSTPTGSQRAQAIISGPSSARNPVVQPTSFTPQRTASQTRAQAIKTGPSGGKATTPPKVTTPTPVRVSAPAPLISSVSKPSPIVTGRAYTPPPPIRVSAPAPKISSIAVPTRYVDSAQLTRQQSIQASEPARQAVIQETQKNQQKLQQQGLFGGFSSIEEQVKAITNIAKPQQAYAQPAPKSGKGITTEFGGFQSKESQQQALKEQVQIAKSLPFGGFGSEFAQKEATTKAQQKAKEKYPDVLARATSAEGIVSNPITNPPAQRQQITKNVEVGGPSFIGGISTAEKTSTYSRKELPLQGILPEPNKESRKQILLEQRGGSPQQQTVGSLAIERLQEDQILGRNEQIGKTQKVVDPLTGKVTTRQVTPATGLEKGLNLETRREQDTFRALNVVQADIVKPLNVRPADNKGSPELGIKFLEAKQAGQIKEPTIITNFGKTKGVLPFEYKDELGRVSGTVGGIGSAGFESFGLERESTRGALKTTEGRAEVQKRLNEPDFSIYESFGYQPPSKPTGQIIVTANKPLGQVSQKPIQGPQKPKKTEAPQSIGGIPFLTPASLISGEQEQLPPPPPPERKTTKGLYSGTNPYAGNAPAGKINQASIFGGSIIPEAYAEEYQSVQKTAKGKTIPPPPPEPKKNYNPFSPSGSYKDTSRTGEFINTLGEKTGVKGAVKQVSEYGTGFGESLQNELINIQNFGSFVSQGQIEERPTFQTPSEQVFAGTIGGAIKQATGQGSFTEEARKGFEGAGKTIKERPAYSAGDITAQAILFLPAGIYKAGSLGVKTIGGLGKALTGVKTAVKAVPKTVAGKVGSLQTRATQAEIRLGQTFREDINPASFYESKLPSATKTEKLKSRPPKPTEEDYERSFARERAFTSEEPYTISKPRGKIRPAKPQETDYAQAFANERAFAQELPRGAKAPSRIKSPTSRIDPLERIQEAGTDNTRLFREQKAIKEINNPELQRLGLSRTPIQDLPVGQADIGFPFVGLGKTSVEGIIARGGRATTVRLGEGIGGFVEKTKGGRARINPTAPSDDLSRVTRIFGEESGEVGKATKATKAERSASEFGEFGEGSKTTKGTRSAQVLEELQPPRGKGLKSIGKAEERPPKFKGKAKAGEEGLPEELRGFGKEKFPKPKGKIRGGLLPLAGFGTSAGISAGLIPQVTADTGQKGFTGQQEDLFFENAQVSSQLPRQKGQTGQKQIPSVKAREQYRYDELFKTETPTVTRGRTVQTPVQRQRLREEQIFGFPEETPARGKPPRGGGFIFGGGGNEGEGLSQRSRKYFTVYDVAKTPFGRVERGLGVQVQSEREIFEVSDVLGKSPRRNISESYFGGGGQVAKTRSKLKKGENPLFDESLFG